jgi:hypothetical protein
MSGICKNRSFFMVKLVFEKSDFEKFNGGKRMFPKMLHFSNISSRVDKTKDKT